MTADLRAGIEALCADPFRGYGVNVVCVSDLRALLASSPAESPAAGAVAARIGSHGPCWRRDRHDPHIETSGIVDDGGNIVLDECPGQSADCSNCDDRKCMACVFREIHSECLNDCPDCCCPDCGVCSSRGAIRAERVDAILVAVFDNFSKGEL